MIESAIRADYHGQVRHDVIPLVPHGARLIDIGGGLGRTASELKRLGRCEVAGLIDLHAPPPGGGLDFTDRSDLADPATLSRIAAEYGPFDTALLLDVAEHFTDPAALLAGVYAALKPGGALVASIPNVRHCSVVLPLLLRGRWDYADSGVLDRTHLRFFTRSSMRRLIEAANFRIERIVPTAAANRRQRLAIWLTLGLLRDFFSVQYYVVARRAGAV